MNDTMKSVFLIKCKCIKKSAIEICFFFFLEVFHTLIQYITKAP